MQGIVLKKTESDIREGLYIKKHESRKHILKELISATLKRYFHINPKSFTTIKPI